MVNLTQLRSYCETSCLTSMTIMGGTTKRIETLNLEIESQNAGNVNLGRMTRGRSM